MLYPRVLVLSNNSFSKSSSNGRTLGNFFIGWPKDSLAQFCVSTAIPDYDLCDNYYLVSDKCAVESFLHLKKAPRCAIKEWEQSSGNTVIRGKRVFKTSWLALLRHIVWSNKRWRSKEFEQWVNDFNPEIVLVMNTDAPFLLDMSVEISKTRNIPLVMFNTEGFYFFKRCYYRRSKVLNNFFFEIYQSIYKRHFRTVMRQVSLSIYGNTLLRDDYEREFGGESIVLYTASSLVSDSSNLHTDSPTFSYLGNFGFDRPLALIEIANVLQSLDPSYKLDVYGKAPSYEIEKSFIDCIGINYKGKVSYDEVIRVIYDSTILFHAEAQVDYYQESLKYGFTTKIADSISSGHPFLIYSSPEIAGAKYILETGAGWYAKDKDELRSQIITILTEESQRAQVLEKAKEIAYNNHKLETITKKFFDALVSLLQ